MLDGEMVQGRVGILFLLGPIFLESRTLYMSPLRAENLIPILGKSEF